ncbi:hypothetical protein HF908_00900 [Ralstonia pseudosolanacearum]|uniref:hypothetical protein n=1 Tax=Ralstonia pseudosolanacearum TaxID=1310165 RepID=UPI001867A267|nr:hypothetical protein [Ralstonia pseudosolanacearum]QOK90195.1 hypothetical protein HF908_00900 [Ralstonia pseudosolanacearum]
MDIADRVTELLERQQPTRRTVQDLQAQYRELMEKGLVEKRTYDLPQVNVMGSATTGLVVY